MIVFTKGNLIEADVEALVNTVNTVGVMGKGIALQFKQAFPENFKTYQKAYNQGELKIGRILVVPTNRLTNPKYILNFPTKKHWRSKAKIEYIDEGLIDLKRIILEKNITSIAVPPLGCGFGGLNWEDVKPQIEKALEEVGNIHALVFEPEGAPKPDEIRIGTKRPNMTVGKSCPN